MSEDHCEPSFFARYLPRKVVLPALLAGTLAGSALFAMLRTAEPYAPQEVTYEQQMPRKPWAERAYNNGKKYANDACGFLFGDDAAPSPEPAKQSLDTRITISDSPEQK